LLEAQLRFEEICGKTLYNLGGQSVPFDADSPYWVVPNARKLARALGVGDSEVTRIVAGYNRVKYAHCVPPTRKSEALLLAAYAQRWASEGMGERTC
jgi:hypothetical protein